MLSKIERGLLFPTLPTLLRIAIVFNTGLEHFFTNEDAGPQTAVIRKRQRLKFPNAPGGKSPAYFFESLDFPITDSKIAAFYAEFTSDRLVSAPHAHEGAELIYQLRGKLRVTVGDEQTVLSPGDAMYFDSGASRQPCQTRPFALFCHRRHRALATSTLTPAGPRCSNCGWPAAIRRAFFCALPCPLCHVERHGAGAPSVEPFTKPRKRGGAASAASIVVPAVYQFEFREFQESEVESSEHQDNSNIHCQRSQNRFLKNAKSTPTMTTTIATA